MRDELDGISAPLELRSDPETGSVRVPGFVGANAVLQSPAVSYEGADLDAMAAAVNYREWILGSFEPYIGDMVAEVGAGKGDVSASILSRGVREFHALEPSAEMYPHLVRRLSGRTGVTTHAATLPDLPASYSSYFDTLLYVNVMEHIADDEAELHTVSSVLRPSGHVCIFVPALPWLYSRFDESLGHHRRYLAQPLASLMRRCGFEIVELRYFDLVGILPWLINFRLLDRPMKRSHVATYDRWIVPALRRAESVINVPIGKSLLAVGRKII